jgi:hypothetical protein
MNYKPEDMVVTITLPDGTKHVVAGWADPYQNTMWPEKPYRTEVSGTWNVELYKEEEDEQEG